MEHHHARPKKHAFRPGLMAAVIASAFIVAGCAKQQTPGYYETGPESTLSDAQHQAQGRTIQRAPSQLQLGFGNTQENRRLKRPPLPLRRLPTRPSPLSPAQRQPFAPCARPKRFWGQRPACLTAARAARPLALP
ncbi:hypothetical protein [Neopusillimonas aromaticivorans]|uniref:hypothetical protein n=1 Tax=Neopusillimonas aromaticivorans TaxID=2979868 RepID=UPI002599A134|nr:hypothetical protein [Neopusillimonas aromaticivorans]WJJ92785.1 hypothetical protein N7E01_11020 [Neopusillimonas aromaticivorans]